MRLSLNWGAGITLVYLAFAGSTLGFVVFAMTQPVDLVSADYYSRSLKQDERTIATTRVNALGDRVGVSLSPDRQSLDLRIPVEGAAAASGRITWYRPSDSRADLMVVFHPGTDGRQQIPLKDIPAGRWLLQVEWQSAGQSFYLERPVIVP